MKHLVIRIIIDMHTHTKRYSICSKITLEQILNNLSSKVDGIVITDHQTLYSGPLKGLRSKYGKKIFTATEITSLEGDILAYGIDDIPNKDLPAEKVIENIHKQKGIAIAAHPFRKYGLGDFIFDLDIDGIEVNGLANSKENEQAKKAASILELPLIGGSDVHQLYQLNTFATKFWEPIASIDDIIRQIKEKKCKPIQLFNSV